MDAATCDSEEALLTLGALEGLCSAGAIDLLEVSREVDAATFREGHIPGAAFVYWKELLWHPTDRTLVSRALLEERLARLGIVGERPLAIYGDPVQYGTYAYWVFEHTVPDRNVRLVNGTARTWQQSGRQLESSSQRPASIDTGRDRPSSGVGANGGHGESSCTVGRDSVRSAISRDDVQIVDARSAEEYRGERVSPGTMGTFDHGAERAGRVPGAIHLRYDRFVQDDDRFLGVDEIKSIVTEAGLRSDLETYVYCRLSHRASLVWFVLTYLLGFDRVRVYDGSWTEWGSMVDMPVEV